MPDNRNMSENEDLPLDTEDWEIAFEPYEGHPQAALTLGFHLTEMKREIQALRMRDALAAIHRAVDQLYKHSEFRNVSHELFLTAVQGALTNDKEELLRQLGIKI